MNVILRSCDSCNITPSFLLQVQPVLSFTFEEEFKVMDYIVRIEQYQNRRFEFVCGKFPHYNLVLAGIIRAKGEGAKIPFNSTIDRTLFNIGLDFTKQACVVSLRDCEMYFILVKISYGHEP